MSCSWVDLCVCVRVQGTPTLQSLLTMEMVRAERMKWCWIRPSSQKERDLMVVQMQPIIHVLKTEPNH